MWRFKPTGNPTGVNSSFDKAAWVRSRVVFKLNASLGDQQRLPEAGGEVGEQQTTSVEPYHYVLTPLCV